MVWDGDGDGDEGGDEVGRHATVAGVGVPSLGRTLRISRNTLFNASPPTNRLNIFQLVKLEIKRIIFPSSVCWCQEFPWELIFMFSTVLGVSFTRHLPTNYSGFRGFYSSLI